MKMDVASVVVGIYGIIHAHASPMYLAQTGLYMQYDCSDVFFFFGGGGFPLSVDIPDALTLPSPINYLHVAHCACLW